MFTSLNQAFVCEHAFASEDAGMNMARMHEVPRDGCQYILGQIVRCTRHFSYCIECAGVHSAAARKEDKVGAMVQQLQTRASLRYGRVHYNLAQQYNKPW
jgi:hypothetical protein